ncbi:D-alanyl-D-alanine carboxypeptidase [Vibrio sp. V27_P1S3P104]|uniref:D-alanyl-D-alanine carboxypeptidase family protein n=1 Tax=Vibrio TaxID=662 RepID=UPI000C163649|nr:MULTISPECIES: D-alanyl-D-alanine carboxypeptidase family protein [Vibrio]NAW69104.1 D-alanyl-D-alanine carboxypeptidase [Vibrio sp. V28_P6S34P95]NAX06345.1 D-alanyl-D-alanine carboxypeptidase [Vibrio sp. V30_P3S12P165]NAX33001.1 D-alanyl-D-alanine carboxypeptidase [Vibrio sp. V29_P1S30P107]NAX36069.1 D-alanyl-D-alanine carboxypeptidase [Vibrio sp. V27_P1S3P104]NAX41007.1 D-alanyl-D-alanine carboxypeptidase [Vibrio sp. V26_P1S5P106]
MKNIKSIVLSTIGLSLLPSLGHSTPIVVPNPPQLSAKGYVLMDYHTGRVLVQHHAHERLNPASLTKLMTSYVAGQGLKQGKISAADQVTISHKAWAKNFPDSSKMFIEVGKQVNMMDLYRGLIVQSGNDASVAIAEHVAGSESAFVDLMNLWAQKLGLENTSFTNPHGLDSEGLYSTPYDIAKLAQAIIRDLPEIYPLYSETSFSYNGITQYNRNGLLRDRSLNVDGMKTGFTSGAGYSLATSATDGDMRLISVVMGANSQKSRESESKQLLSYGFRFFETISPHQNNEVLESVRIWSGKQDQVAVGVAHTTYLTLIKGELAKLSGVIELDKELEAPLKQGEVIGKVIYQVDGHQVGEAALVALETVEEGNWFKRLFDSIKRFFAGWF